jgi:hypothetical protein
MNSETRKFYQVLPIGLSMYSCEGCYLHYRTLLLPTPKDFLELLIPDLYRISRDTQYNVAVFLFHSVEDWGWTETSW